MKKFILLIVAIILYVSASNNAQDESIPEIHPLSGKIGWSIEGGGNYALADFHTHEINYFGRTMFEYFYPTVQPGIVGIRGFAAGGFLSGSGSSASSRTDLDHFKTTFIQAGAGVEYLLMFSHSVHPYLFVGGSYLYFDPKDNNGDRLLRNRQKDYSRNDWTINGELGFKFLVSEDVSLNVGANVNYFPDDNLDDVVAGSDRDIFFTGFGGITIFFGGIKDTDRDGIRDTEDLCPDTPYGIHVDVSGCPIDSDADRVPDYLDKCPNTPNGMPVDKKGCPLDTDEDGVPDFADLCKDTPEGVSVDKRGCPFDEDEDGVPDYKDRCPNTPVGTEVNSAGCPPKENKKQLPEKTSLSVSGNVLFEVGKSELLSGAMSRLDEIVSILIENPDTRWFIAGYTDNTGSYELNKKLSLARANSVANYFVQSGVSRSRLEVIGYGPDNPIADNSTESGRAMNRRVTIDFISGNSIPGNREQKPVTGTMGYDYSNETHVGGMIFSDGNTYVFQVASFRLEGQANSVVETLNKSGEKAFVVKVNPPDLEGTWYRVRVGYYATLNDARENQRRIMNILK